MIIGPHCQILNHAYYLGITINNLMPIHTIFYDYPNIMLY
jgi:hypothetical protein